MNKRNIPVLNGIIIISFLVLVILGCGGRLGDKTVTNGKQQSAEYKDSSDGTMQNDMIEIVDLAGRTVTIPTGDVKVILDGNLLLYSISVLFGKGDNPLSHIVGWKNDMEKYDPDTYEMYQEKFPDISTIPDIGSFYEKDFSTEQVISLNPDIFFIRLSSLSSAQEIGLVEKLEKAGIKTVFTDFYKEPTNIIPSILLLGQIFQKTAQASAFANFYFAQMQKIYSVVKDIQEDKKPLVFMEEGPNSGWEQPGEYWVYGYNSYGRFVELAGGKNYGTKPFEGKRGKMSAESLLSVDPDVIIGTGTNWSKARPTTKAVLLGYKADKKDSQERLQNIVSRVGWKTLNAIKNKRLHIIWHRFEDSAYHFIAIQQIAKWIYPDKFADLDPEKTFIELHNKFLPIDYNGMFWTSLE